MSRFKDLEKATQVIQNFMQEMIQTRRQEFAAGVEPQSDVLSLMVQSAENEGKLSMTDSELVSHL